MAIIDQALAGQIALVTGGSRGIGKAICVALAKRGATVAINYVSNQTAAEAVAEEIQALGGKSVLCGFDVSDHAAAQAAIDGLAKAQGGLHILVNNAGIAVNGLLMRFSAADWDKVLRVNLGGTFACTKAAMRYLLSQKNKARIINISSVVGESGNAGQAAYAAAKAGMIGFTKATAKEVASRGVTVNVISPGFIETEMTQEHLPEAQKATLMTQIPLGRIGQAEEIADVASFLAGPEASYITGQVLRVNGGLLM